MPNAETLITENIDTWSAAIKKKASAGRGKGRGNKREFYGITRLRELIFELAVRGLLVQQDSKEKSALSSVQKSRQLIEEAFARKEIKKQQLPAAREKNVDFALPLGWTHATLPEVAKPVPHSIKRGPFGSSIKKDMFVSAGYKVYEQQHAIYGDFDSGSYYLSEADFQNLLAFELKPTDLIISCSGTVGRVSIAPDSLQPGVINQALLKLGLQQDALANEYFKILFPAYFMELETLSDLQGTAQKNMPGMPVMKSLSFPLPPLAEQHRIVAKVDELMGLCDQLEQQQEDSMQTHQTLVQTLLEALTPASERGQFEEAWQRIESNFDTLFTTESSIDELKQTILQLAVMGKLVPQDPSDESSEDLLRKCLLERQLLDLTKSRSPKLLPESDRLDFTTPQSWSWQSLGDLLVFGPSNGLSPKAVDFETPVKSLTLSATTSGKFNPIHSKFLAVEIPEHSDLWLQKGDILVQRGNTYEYVGVSAVYQGSPDTFIYPDLMMKLRFCLNLDTQFIHIAMSHQRARTFLRERASGTSGNMPKINQKTLKSLPIPIPPLAEQHRIVAKVDGLMTLCDALKANLKAAQTTQLTLADTLTGQISNDSKGPKN